MDFLRSGKPPALTTGLVLFIVLLRVVGASDALRLTPGALFSLDLNRLSFYPLVFYNWAHLIVGTALFVPLLGQFEVRNGTVRTGVVLNVTAFFVGIVSNLLAFVSSDKLFDGDFCGSSSWILAFAGMLSITTWNLPVLPIRSVVVSVPGFVLPLVVLVLFTLYRPQYWLVHSLSLAMGYLLALGHLGFLVEGTTNVIEWIEGKLDVGINGLRYIVHFLGEVEAREIRKSTSFRRGSITADELPVSLTNPSEP